MLRIAFPSIGGGEGKPNGSATIPDFPPSAQRPAVSSAGDSGTPEGPQGGFRGFPPNEE